MQIKVKEECSACGGTGLYQGMAERDGYAVVCARCEGTGCFTISYTPFTERKRPKGVRTVIKTNPGIMLGGTMNFGGMPFKDWDAGKPFPKKSEMREFTCPAWWYQNADYKKKPEWKECNQTLGSSFRKCPSFGNKKKCWERWDKEYK